MGSFELQLREALSQINEAKTPSLVTNIESGTLENENYRKVIHTSKKLQVVLMSVSDEIGEETHDDTDQFIRVESGKGQAILDGKVHDLSDGSAVVIPAGTKHNIVCTSDDPLKLYSIYSPPHHPEDTVQKNRPSNP